jgi:hypothetical protein
LALLVAVQLCAVLNDVISELLFLSKAERIYDAGLVQFVGARDVDTICLCARN